MSVSISGILLDPFGQPASFAEVRFITWQGANDVLTTAPAVFKTSADGAYSFAVEFGTFTVQVRYNQSNGKFQTIKQKVVVNSNVTATTLGELLLFNEPLTPPEIAYVEQLVAEAEGYRDEAEGFALASEASSQTSEGFSQASATSAAESAQSATDAANSAALIAPVPLNGGVWASGQTYNFYNEYMIYNGEAYSPLPATVLPYTVGTVPDLGFVYQIKLNDHSLLANRNAVDAHDQIYRRATTVAEIESGAFIPTGSEVIYLSVKDRANAPFDLAVGGGTPNGYDIIDAGNGNAALLKTKGAVSAESFGFVGGDVDNSPALLALLQSNLKTFSFPEVYTIKTHVSASLLSSKVIRGEGGLVWGGGVLDDRMFLVDCAGHDFEIGICVDGADLASGGFRVINTTPQTGDLPTCTSSGGVLKNFFMANSNSANACASVVGSFELVEIKDNQVGKISRAAGTGIFGVAGTNGIYVQHSGVGFYPKKVLHYRNDYSGMGCQDTGAQDVDTDYFAVLLPDPTNFLSDAGAPNRYPPVHVESHSNTYNNPLGRAIKMQCVPFIHGETINREGGRTIRIFSADIDCQWGVGTVEDITFNYSSLGGQSPITTDLVPISFYHGSSYGESVSSATARRIIINNNIPDSLNNTLDTIVDLNTSTTTFDQNVGQVTLEDITMPHGKTKHLTHSRWRDARATVRFNNILLNNVVNSLVGLGDGNRNVVITCTNTRQFGPSVNFADNYRGGSRIFEGKLSGWGNEGFNTLYKQTSSEVGGSPLLTGAALSGDNKVGGSLSVEAVSLLDNGVHTFNKRGVRDGNFLFAVSVNINGVGDIFAANGTSAIQALTTTHAASFSLGAGSNPATAGKINMWVDATGQLNIDNRSGASLIFTITFMG